jgi:putative SOS response-associated peptidase YedK
MSGRYASSQPPEFIARIFPTVNELPNIAPPWNIALSQQAMVVRRRPRSGELHLDLLQWGLVPHCTKDAAQAKTKPINACRNSRHVRDVPRRLRAASVPADAFYEWKATEGGKQHFAIARQDGQPIAFAGLWEASAGPMAPCCVCSPPSAPARTPT